MALEICHRCREFSSSGDRPISMTMTGSIPPISLFFKLSCLSNPIKYLVYRFLVHFLLLFRMGNWCSVGFSGFGSGRFGTDKD